MSYPQLQGASSQLIIQPGETLTEQKNGLAKLTRTYCCGASYAATAKTILVSGYVPSGYPYLALFQLPSEKVENGIATFTCEFYGVLSTDRYYQPYDSIEANLADGVVNYIDLAGITLAPIAYSADRPLDANGIPLDVITTDTFQYAAPTLIRSFVVPSSDGFAFQVPSISDFQSVPISEFHSVITKGVSVNGSMRPLAPQRIVSATGRSVGAKRALITDYGAVRVVEAAYELTVSPEIVSVGAGTLENRPIYVNQSVAPCTAAVTNLINTHGGPSDLGYTSGTGVVGANSVRVSLSWDEPSVPSSSPIIGYLVGFERKYVAANDGAVTSKDYFFTKNHSSIYPSLGTGYEPGVYECSVATHNVYGSSQDSTTFTNFVQAGPATEPPALTVNQAIVSMSSESSTGYGGISVSFAAPYWDGISDRVGESPYSEAAIIDYKLVLQYGSLLDPHDPTSHTISASSFTSGYHFQIPSSELPADPHVSGSTLVVAFASLTARTAAGYGATRTVGVTSVAP